MAFRKIAPGVPTFIKQRLNTEPVDDGDRLVVVPNLQKLFRLSCREFPVSVSLQIDSTKVLSHSVNSAPRFTSRLATAWNSAGALRILSISRHEAMYVCSHILAVDKAPYSILDLP